MRPVFVIGAERSGTTILGSVLGAPTDGLTIPESHFFVENVLSHSRQAEFPSELPKIWKNIARNPRFQLWDWQVDTATEKALIKNPTVQSFWQSLVREYGKTVGRPSPSYWVDHTPMHALHITALIDLFPEARFVHIVRDPRAVAASILSLRWGPATREDFPGYWLQKVGCALMGQITFPNKFSLVKYEDFIASPEETLKILSKNLDLPHLDSRLPLHFKVPAASNKQHSYLNSGIIAGVSSNWEERLTVSDVEYLEGALGGLMDVLGYGRQFPDARLTYGVSRVNKKKWDSIIGRLTGE